MPDHDANDPLDKAYAQSEALLGDEAARAARRDRVLAAALREATPVPFRPAERRRGLARGGWLVAASVAGLSVLVAAQIYRPTQIPEQAAPTARAPAVSGPTASPAPTANAPEEPPRSTPPRTAVTPRDPPAPALGEPLAAPAPPPAAEAPGAAAAMESVVTAQRRAKARDEAEDAAIAPRSSFKAAADAGLAASPAPAPPPAPRARGEALTDPGARLRDAAGAGRVAELKALLAKGAPVDAPDADGETALMKSVQADQPAAAALLRRRGANLDRRNHAGESARDMARAVGDDALNEALGLD